MIRLDNVSKVIGKKQILKNINLNVEVGKICGLVGRNGAGKTSLLKCIMGLWKIDSGEIYLNKNNIENGYEFKSFTSLIPDEINIPNSYSVYETSRLYKYGFKNFDKLYFDKLLDIYKIEYKEKIRNMSKGTKLKLMMALNLSRKPDILILDEPLSNLDPVSRRELINILIACASDKQITIIISTHNILDVQKFCDIFVIMEQSEILDVGSCDYLKDKIKMIKTILLK
jgi:ABC-2 type transport system ATP-binding protein